MTQVISNRQPPMKLRAGRGALGAVQGMGRPLNPTTSHWGGCPRRETLPVFFQALKPVKCVKSVKFVKPHFAWSRRPGEGLMNLTDLMHLMALMGPTAALSFAGQPAIGLAICGPAPQYICPGEMLPVFFQAPKPVKCVKSVKFVKPRFARTRRPEEALTNLTDLTDLVALMGPTAAPSFAPAPQLIWPFVGQHHN